MASEATTPSAPPTTTAKADEARMEQPVRDATIPAMDEKDALATARAGGWEVDALVDEMEAALAAAQGQGGGGGGGGGAHAGKGPFDLEFRDPRHFTWAIVAFASMGGLLSGLDQSLISGANLYLPRDLGLDTRQNSLVNSAMPLGAVGGALVLSPCNEWFGRRWSIIVACVLYTVGAALEAGSVNYGMPLA
jgi:hypothetical protein